MNRHVENFGRERKIVRKKKMEALEIKDTETEIKDAS